MCRSNIDNSEYLNLLTFITTKCNLYTITTHAIDRFKIRDPTSRHCRDYQSARRDVRTHRTLIGNLNVKLYYPAIGSVITGEVAVLADRFISYAVSLPNTLFYEETKKKRRRTIREPLELTPVHYH